MKKVLLTMLLLSLGLVATLAQSQLGMNYQAVIRNADGKIIADTKVGIQINILKESTSGESVYTETFTPTTNEFGLITLVIGQGQAKYGKYSSIDWSSAKYFLKIELDIVGGTAYEEMGVSQLLSVPYANYAFDGVGGKSAYQIWLDLGNTGSEDDFINSLTGPLGKSAYQIWLDLGNTGSEDDFIASISALGRSVYQIWLDEGNVGNQQDFLNSLTGPSGTSAYQIWLEQPDNIGKTEEEFISSITGTTGKSAYQIWLDQGNIGTEDNFLNSLIGSSGSSSWIDAEANVSTKQKVGIGTNNPNGMLEIVSDGKNPDVPLFEVKNSKGETIFAVYENGVKIILDEETGGEKNRGGFAISGRTTTKEGEADIFTVTPNLTQVFVEESTTKNRGGFAISGRTTTKEGETDIFTVTPSLTQVFVDESTTKNRGGFAISGRTTTKEGEADILTVTPSLTQVFVEESTTKNRGGFAISGRTTTKEGEADIFTVTPTLTEVFVNEPTAKNRGGFAISGRTTTKAPVELLNMTPSLTQFYVVEPTTKNRGGFAISGRTTTKEGEADILTVTPSLTQVFVEEPTAKNRGGFAISGRTTTKAPVDLLNMTPSLTQFYVEEPSTKNRGGFAISGRTTTKEGEADILTVTPNLTQVYVNETTTKNRGGFAISGRTTTKESGTYDVLTVVPERTDVYLKPSNSKNSLPIGFGIHGLKDNNPSETTEFFSISGAGTYVATPMAVSATVITGIIKDRTETSATGGGKVTDTGGTEATITASGIVYHNGSVPTIENINNLSPGVGGIISGGSSSEFNDLIMLNLTPSTTYKVRAFAINSDGLTSYGEPREFTTLRKIENIITVNVSDVGGTAIPNATVTFINNDIQEEPIIRTTNSSGTCTVELGNNNYTYKVEADGYYAYTLDNAYKPANNETIDVQLTSIHTTGNLVTFTVKDQDGVAVSGVSIKYVTIQTYEKYTNSEGVVTFYLGTQSTDYWVTPPKGYEDIPMGTVSPETQSTVDITLKKQFKVTFRVKDPQGIPATMTNGSLENGSAWANIEVINGIAEVFVPADEAVGIWTYNMNSEYGYFATGTIEIKTGDTEFVKEVTLQSPQKEFTVKYRIGEIDNTPIAGAKVHLTGIDVDELAFSDAAGMVTFTKVKATGSENTLTIEKDGFSTHIEYTGFDHNSDEYNPETPGILNVKEVVLYKPYTVNVLVNGIAGIYDYAIINLSGNYYPEDTQNAEDGNTVTFNNVPVAGLWYDLYAHGHIDGDPIEPNFGSMFFHINATNESRPNEATGNGYFYKVDYDDTQRTVNIEITKQL